MYIVKLSWLDFGLSSRLVCRSFTCCPFVYPCCVYCEVAPWLAFVLVLGWVMEVWICNFAMTDLSNGSYNRSRKGWWLVVVHGMEV